jgi:hypothetical protein
LGCCGAIIKGNLVVIIVLLIVNSFNVNNLIVVVVVVVGVGVGVDVDVGVGVGVIVDVLVVVVVVFDVIIVVAVVIVDVVVGVVMFSALLSCSIILSILFMVLFCFVSVLKLALKAFENVSTPFVVPGLLSHFVICCCVVVVFLLDFSVESGGVVRFVVVADMLLLMFGASGLSVALLNASSAIVKSSFVTYVALVLEFCVCLSVVIFSSSCEIILAKKQKLVAKILWFITQIPPNMIPEYSDLFFEDLIHLPLPNLLHLEAILHPRLWQCPHPDS